MYSRRLDMEAALELIQESRPGVECVVLHNPGHAEGL